MTQCPQLHVGDNDVPLAIKVVDQDGEPVDLSGGTGMTITVRRPDGTSVTRSATAELDDVSEVSCILQILSETGDFNLVGRYRYQGQFTALGVGPVHTQVISFEVLENL